MKQSQSLFYPIGGWEGKREGSAELSGDTGSSKHLLLLSTEFVVKYNKARRPRVQISHKTNQHWLKCLCWNYQESAEGAGDPQNSVILCSWVSRPPRNVQNHRGKKVTETPEF